MGARGKQKVAFCLLYADLSNPPTGSRCGALRIQSQKSGPTVQAVSVASGARLKVQANPSSLAQNRPQGQRWAMLAISEGSDSCALHDRRARRQATDTFSPSTNKALAPTQPQ